MELKLDSISQILHDIAVEIISTQTGHSPIERTRKQDNYQSRIIYCKIMSMLGFNSFRIAERIGRTDSQVRQTLRTATDKICVTPSLSYNWSVCTSAFFKRDEVKLHIERFPSPMLKKYIGLESIIESLSNDNKKLNDYYDKYSRGFVILDSVLGVTPKGKEREMAIMIKRLLNGAHK
jgi:hypothetical protein